MNSAKPVKPSKPDNLKVKPTAEGFLEVIWTRNPPEENVEYYSVYRGTRKEFVPEDSSLVNTTVGNSFLDSDVTGSTYYLYKVVAVDASGNKSDPSGPEIGKSPVDKILEQVTAFCLIAIAFLIFFYFVYDWRIFDNDSFVLNLDGNPTFTDDTLTAIINNNNDAMTLTLYGVDKFTISDIDATGLADNTGSVLIPFSAELANTPNVGFPNSSEIILSVNSNDIKSGIFEGLVVVQAKEISSVPVMLATEPLIIQAIIISGIGILVSIILWEFIKYFKKNNDEQARQELLYNTLDAQENADINRNQYMFLKSELDDIDNKLAGLRAIAHSNPKEESKFISLTKERQTIAQLAEEKMKLESLYRVSADVNRQAAVRKSQDVENYKSRSLRPRSLWSKIIITEFGSAIFGISLGIFGLLSNEFVLGLRTMDPFQVTVLFGLGLGIGSLKELVDK